MNKLALIYKSKRFLIIYKLLATLDVIDVVKLCLMTSAFSQINKIMFQSISDLFQIFASSISSNSNEMIQIVEDIEFLKRNNVVKIENNKASLMVYTNIDSFDFLPKEVELLGQINNMKIDSMMRFIVRYV